MSERLAADKGLRAAVNGFTAVLHTWNQRLEFLSLRHVLPRGLSSVRYYGFCHPTSKASRLRLRSQAGLPVQFGATDALPPPKTSSPPCPCCGRPMRRLGPVRRAARPRGPPLFTDPTTHFPAA